MTTRQKVDLMIKTARHLAASRRALRKEAMTRSQWLQYGAFNALPRPGILTSEETKGKLVMDHYLGRPRDKHTGRFGSSNGRLTPFEEKILSSRGTAQSIYKYLNGEGRRRVPELVEGVLGDTWYTGPAKLLARTPIGRGIVVDKVMDRVLPRINGSTDVARLYLQAGGTV
jgi:hypothetical protein